MRAHGLAGDATPAKLCSLANASAILRRPMSISLVGVSGVGKQQKLQRSLDLHPPETFHLVDASSPRSLIYSEEEYRNRIIVLSEADAIPEEGPAASFVRTLIHEARASYEVVEKGANGSFKTRRIEKEGPTGLITTGVRSLRPQLRTRVLEVHLSEHPEDVFAVLDAMMMQEDGRRDDLEGTVVSPNAWRAFHRWLRTEGRYRTVVPFASAIVPALRASGVIPPASLQRQIQQAMSCLKTIALINQIHREHDDAGQVVVTLDDYAAMHRLLAPVVDAAMQGGVSEEVRETVEAIRPIEKISLTDLGKRLSIAKSTASARVQAACELGLLVNHEWRKGHPARIQRGESLPPQQDVLPTVEAVRRAHEQSKQSTEPTGFANEAEQVINALTTQLIKEPLHGSILTRDIGKVANLYPPERRIVRWRNRERSRDWREARRGR